MKNRLRNFLNDNGQVIQWPAKYSNQQLVLEYLALQFDTKSVYTESQVNGILKTWHTFGDWALLRRALVDEGYMQRKTDGSEYRRLR